VCCAFNSIPFTGYADWTDPATDAVNFKPWSGTLNSCTNAQ